MTAAGGQTGRSRPRLVMFDLDGTLADTAPDLAASIDQLMADLGLPACGSERVERWIGGGVEKLVERALTDRLGTPPATAQLARGISLFHAIYAEHNGRSSRLYPGVRDTLDELHSAGIGLACVTNKPSEFTIPLLEKLAVRAYLATAVCGDMVPARKPDPAPLLQALRQFALSPEQALMVGDSANDVAAARAAGIAVIGVSYGYAGEGGIRASSPDAVIDSMAELTTAWQ